MKPPFKRCTTVYIPSDNSSSFDYYLAEDVDAYFAKTREVFGSLNSSPATEPYNWHYRRDEYSKFRAWIVGVEPIQSESAEGILRELANVLMPEQIMPIVDRARKFLEKKCLLREFIKILNAPCDEGDILELQERSDHLKDLAERARKFLESKK